MRSVKHKIRNVHDYHSIFSDNSFAGEMYDVKLLNDNTLYAGIPIARSRLVADSSDTFSFNIIEPEARSGVFDVPFHEIEYAVRKVRA